MGTSTKYVVVEIKFDYDSVEPPHIKDWWLKSQVATAMANHLPVMKTLINNVRIETREVHLLPEEISIKTKNIFKV